MKLTITPLILTSLLLTSLIGATNVSATPLKQDKIAQLDAQLQQNAERYKSVAQSVLVLKNNQPVYRGLNGFANLELSVAVKDNHQFPVYSLSKLFTSVTLMTLVEQNKINLDATIGAYLPELPKSWHNVTLRHCLNHTSGLPPYWRNDYAQRGFPADKATIFSDLANADFQFKTGKKNKYNNTNYLVLTSVIEKVTGQSYLTNVTKHVIEPLGLKNTFYAQAKNVIPNLVSSYWGKKGEYFVDKGVDWPTYTFSHSALYSNVEDLRKFMSGVTQGKILKPQTLKQMWQPMKLNNGQAGKYASGWEYSSHDKLIQVGHEGGNRVRVSYHFNPDNKEQSYTVVYLTNGNGYDGWSSHLVEGIVATLSPQDFPLAALQENMLDSAFLPDSKKQLDQIAAGFTNNPLVQNIGQEQFVRYRAYNLFYSAEPKSSIPMLALYTRLYPDTAIGWKNLALGWQSAGDKQKAIGFVQKALSLDPQLQSAKQLLATLMH